MMMQVQCIHSEAPHPPHSGPHSKTWMAFPKGCSAPVVVKSYTKVVKFELLKEVEALSRLHHPNIVKLADVASVNKLPSMITEYRGANFDKLI